jgi:hypothetical protein
VGASVWQRDLPGGRRRLPLREPAGKKGGEVDRLRATTGGDVLAQDLEGGQEAFAFEDFLPQVFLAFFDLLESEGHAMQC